MSIDKNDELKLQNMQEAFIAVAQAVAAKATKDGYIFAYQDSCADKVIEDYKENRDFIKNLIDKEEFPADRHKIAAFMLIAIVRNKPIKLKTNRNKTNNNDIEMITNINLAASFANRILRSFYEEEHKEKLTLKFPDTTNGNNYLHNFHALINLLNGELDNSPQNKALLLSISHIFYLIEEFSKK